MAGLSAKTQQSFQAAAARISAAARLVRPSFGAGLRMIGEEIMTDVKASRPGHGVPVDRGFLRASGRAEGPEAGPRGPRVTLSFGGAAAPYALVQHEVTSYKHTVGEARYLVRGMQRWRMGGSAAVAAMRAQLKVVITKAKNGG